MSSSNNRHTTRRLCVTAMLMAMNVVLSSFGVPVPGGHLYLNDVVICTAALLLDPAAAFCVGGIGAFLGDLLFYPPPMFVSLVTHGLQAVVISLCVRHSGRKKQPSAPTGTDAEPGSGRDPAIRGAVIGVTLGAIIMVVGYSLGRAYLYSTPEYALLKLPYQILQAAVGAVAGVILYRPLRKVLQHF